MPNRLKEIRAERGITQAELAEILKISENYVNKIENGKRIPNVLLAIRMASALDCRVEDIFFDEHGA